MSYIPTTWVDGETPVNAENLNKLENAVKANDVAINKLEEATVLPAFSSIEYSGINNFSPVMEYGSIDLNTGLDVEGTSNIRTAEFLPVSGDTQITITNDKGYYNRVFEYDADKALVKVHQFTTSPAGLKTQNNTRFIRFRSDLSRVENDLSAVYTLSYIVVGGSINAETPNDTLTLVAGNNITMEFDPQQKKVVIAAQAEKGEKGEKGDTGPAGPQGMQGEMGPAGANGADGKNYVLTDADKTEIAEEAAVLVDVSGKLDKNQGSANVGKILMVDANGNLYLADVPEIGLSGDVVGVVSADNTIVLTGALAEGVYTIKYEMDDGAFIDIGELKLSSEVDVPLTFTLGKIDYENNGAIVDSATYLYTNMITREANTEYTMSLVGEGAQNAVKVVWYDVNDIFLGCSENINDLVVSETGSWPLPMRSDAAKFRMRVYHRSEDLVAASQENMVLTKRALQYANLLSLATGDNGSVLNGTGYADRYRFSSYAGLISNDTATDGYFVTGFIPYTNANAQKKVRIYVKGISLDLTALPEYLRIAHIIPGDSSWFGCVTVNDMTDATQVTITQLGEQYFMIRPNDGFYSYNDWDNSEGGHSSAPTHIRLCLPGSGAGVIITVDDPIE